MQHWQKRTFVYCIGSQDGPVKVGITQNLHSRLRVLQNASPKRLEIVWVFTADTKACAHEAEQWLHWRWAKRRLSGEWFDICAEDAYTGLGDLTAYAAGEYCWGEHLNGEEASP